MPEQTIIATAPTNNAEGFARGIEALRHIVALRELPVGSTHGYDSGSDTFWVQIGAARPSITYFCPNNQLFLLRLDYTTGELTGLELTHFKSVAVKKYPEFRALLPKSWLTSVFKRSSGGARFGFPLDVLSHIAADANCVGQRQFA